MSIDTHSGSDDKMCAGAIPDLLRPEVLDAFDRETFERDGYWVWEGVVTDAGCNQWTANLKKLQRMNDAILMDTDWDAIDFEGRGLEPPPPEQITPQFLSSCCGGSEQMPPFLRAEVRKYMYRYGLLRPGPALIARGFDSIGVMPEYFPTWVQRLRLGCHHHTAADDGVVSQRAGRPISPRPLSHAQPRSRRERASLAWSPVLGGEA